MTNHLMFTRNFRHICFNSWPNQFFVFMEHASKINYPSKQRARKIPPEIDGKMVHAAGFHNATEDQHQGTYGTGKITSLSENDPFGNL